MTEHTADNNVKLTADEAAQWAADLRSGEYKQCKGMLHSKNQFGEYHCCLGVLEVTQNKPRHEDKDNQVLSYKVLPQKTQKTLADMNDNGTSFVEIADYIEKNIMTRRPKKSS